MNRVAVVHCLIMVASVFAKRRRCHLTLSLVEGEVLEQLVSPVQSTRFPL